MSLVTLLMQIPACQTLSTSLYRHALETRRPPVRPAVVAVLHLRADPLIGPAVVHAVAVDVIDDDIPLGGCILVPGGTIQMLLPFS